MRCGYVNGELANCIYVLHCDEGVGGVGGGDSGGWGGGGGSDDSSTTVFIDTQGDKTDPKQENRCFTTSQAATLTVYVEQAKPRTRNHVGPNQVGHTFVGIQQNGITRYLGYYPPPSASSTGLTVGLNYPGEIHENSGHNYDVSISTSITGGQLAAILSYINNYPATYNLNTYNCADFGIAVGNLGGMNLPVTTSNGIFSGRSPGDLGEDIRAMAPPSGSSINTTGGNAPTKQGTCP